MQSSVKLKKNLIVNICHKKSVALLFLCLFIQNRLYAPFGEGGFVKSSTVSAFGSVAIDPNNNNVVVVGQDASIQCGYIAYYMNNGASFISNNIETIFPTPTTSAFSNVFIDGTFGSNTRAFCTGFTTNTEGITTPLLARYTVNTVEQFPTLDPTVFNNEGYYQPAFPSNTQPSATVTTVLSSNENSIVTGQVAQDAAFIGMVINPTGQTGLNTNFNGTGYLVSVGIGGGYDMTFNNSGQVSTAAYYFEYPITAYYGITLDTNGTGNILACGPVNEDGNQGLIFRYLPTGFVDETFINNNNEGYILGGLNDASVVYTAILPQVIAENYYYIAVGQGNFGGHLYGVITRYNSDGSLDTTFNPGGTVGVGGNPGYIADSNFFECYGLAIDGSSRIIVVGTSAPASGNGIIARYSPNGMVDNTFNSSGTSPGYINASNYAGVFYGIALTGSESGTPNEKFVVVGQSPNQQYGVVARYYNDCTGHNPGMLDQSFNSTGFKTDGTTGAMQYKGVVVDSNENVILVGSGVYSASQVGVLVRYTPQGQFDATFNSAQTHGGEGYVYSTALTSTDYLSDQTNSFTAVTLDNQNRIVVVGNGINTQSSTSLGVVARFIGGSLSTAGSLDTSFGNGTYGVGFLYDSTVTSYNAVVTDSSANIVAAGASGNNGAGVVTRYLGAGLPPYSTYQDVLYDTGRTTYDDYIVAVGQNSSNAPILSSYTITGIPGNLVGTTPPVGLPIGNLTSICSTTVGEQTLYVVAGFTIYQIQGFFDNEPSGYIGVLEVTGSATNPYTAFNGSNGNGSGGPGYVVGYPTDNSSFYYDAIVANIGGNPKIIAVGTNAAHTQGIISVFNLTTVGEQLAGTFYTGFNGTGYVTAPTSSSGANAAAYLSVAVDTNGNIVVAGQTSDQTPQGIVARYLPNGQLDIGTYTITELIADFDDALNSAPFWNSGTRILDLSASTLESQGGTILADVSNFSTLMGARLTDPALVTTINFSGNSINSIPGSETFSGTTFSGLTEIILDNNNTQTSEGTSYPGLQTIGAGSFYNLPNLSLSLQNLSNLLSIAPSTFSGTTTLGSLTLGTVSTAGGLTVSGTLPTTTNSTIAINHNTAALTLPAGLFPNPVGTLTVTGNTFETALPAGLFQGPVSSATISSNTNLTVLPNIFSAPVNNLTISNNTQLTSITEGLQVQDSLAITGNTNLTTLPSGIIVGDNLTALNLSNNGFSGIPANLLDNVTTINGNLSVANNTDLTAVPPVAGITITGTLDASNTSIDSIPANTFYNSLIETTDLSYTQVQGLDENSFANATITSVDLSHTPLAGGQVDLFSMDSINGVAIGTINISNTPFGSLYASLAPSVRTGTIAPQASQLQAALHSRVAGKQLIKPITARKINEYYKKKKIPTGF